MLPGSSSGGFGAGGSSPSLFGGAPVIGNSQPFQGGQQTSTSFGASNPFGGTSARPLFGNSSPASGGSSGGLFSSPQFGGASPNPGGNVTFGQSGGGLLGFASSTAFGASGSENGFGGIQSSSPLQGFGGQSSLSTFGTSPSPASSGGGLFGTSSSQLNPIFGGQSPVGFSPIQATSSSSPTQAQGLFGNSVASSGPTIFGGAGPLAGASTGSGSSGPGTGLQFGGSSGLAQVSFGAPTATASTGQASLTMASSGIASLFSGSAGGFGSSSQSSILEPSSSGPLPFGGPSKQLFGAATSLPSTAPFAPVSGAISFGMPTSVAAHPAPETSQTGSHPLDGGQGLEWGSQSAPGSQPLTTALATSFAPAPISSSGFSWGQSSTGASQSTAPLFGSSSTPAASGASQAAPLFNGSIAVSSAVPVLSSGQGSSGSGLMFGLSTSAPISTAQPFGGLPTSAAPAQFGASSGPASSSPTSLFGNPAGQTSTPTLFGSSSPAASAAPTLFGAISSAPLAAPGLFGQSGSTPALGTSGSVGVTNAFSGASGNLGALSGPSASSDPSASGASTSVPLSFGASSGASLLFGASSGAAGVSASSDASAPQTSVGFGVISGSAQGPGSSAPGASSSTGQVAAATTSNVPVGILGTNVPSDISGRSLGDIKKRWNREAKDALVVFKSLASSVSSWDKQILHNTARLDDLAEGYKEMDSEQQALIGQLEAMEIHHAEIHQVLNRLDSEADSLVAQHNPLDYESGLREDLYSRAINVAADLITIDKELRDIMEKKCLGIPRGAESTVQDNPVQTSMGVVDDQLLGLMHMEEKANSLQAILEGIRLRTNGR